MSKEVVEVKHCMLGHGYASLIAYHKLLQNNNHDDILILQDESANQIFTIEHGGKHFSPLPIFPVKESELYNSDFFDGIPTQIPIDVRFSELLNFDFKTFETQKGSLADFMLQEQGIDQNLCLGAKQWGEKMFSDSFSQVQSKIKRHYIAPKGNTRIGYIDGKSLFHYAVHNLEPNICKHSGLLGVDIKKKEIHTKNNIVRYDKLISTIPLHFLMQLCHLPFQHNTSSAGAYFCFLKYTKGFKENQMIYDCDFNSDIIRIFSIRNDFLLAQLNVDSYGKNSFSKIVSRVLELVPSIQNLEFAQELFLPMCYPLEVIFDLSAINSIEILKSNDVIPFGRFGNWEYTDLHELDWTILQ